MEGTLCNYAAFKGKCSVENVRVGADSGFVRFQ